MPVLHAALLVAITAAQLQGQSLLMHIRDRFRSHGRVPYVAYTLEREQLTPDGMRDLEWSYTYHVWYRASDESALGRRLFNGRPQGLEYLSVLFGQACDPGPPTADLFALPPIQTRGESPAPAPSHSPLTVIASVNAVVPPPYDVLSAVNEHGVWDLRLRPRGSPDVNRLREVWADAATFEITRAVVADKLFIEAGPVYDQLDTLTFRMLDGRPVITNIHARAAFDSEPGGDGMDVDYTFSNISFPAALPEWYFQPALYGAHAAQAPL